MEVETKKYKIKGETYFYRANNRAMIEFEKLVGKRYGLITDSAMDLTALLYCGTKAGMKYEKEKFEIEFEDFIDMVDMNLNDIFIQIQEKEVKEDKKKDK